jgi:hypothetical protein
VARQVFQRRYGERVLTLPVSVEVVSMDVTGEQTAYTRRGLIDTGADRSGMSVRMAERLGLYYDMQRAEEVGNLNGVVSVGTAWVWLQLVDDMTGERTRTMQIPIAIETFDPEISWHPDVLIGMDVISHGRLTVDSTSGETVVTFELP